MFELLNRLCDLNGVSGDEDSVRKFILNEISPFCKCSVDNLGNIIALKKGKNIPKNRLMICAHMDEVGLIINGVTDDGYLTFSPVGGIDPRCIFGTCVNVGGKVKGVIGGKAVHHVASAAKDKAPAFSDMYIDIGTTDRDNALEHIQIGDFVSFDSEFSSFGNGFIIGKAIDDRAGCAMMISLIKQDMEFDTYFVFNVQEEVGLRGSTVSSFAVEADIAVVLEATTAADLNGISGDKRVCVLGDGPVVSFMDSRTIYNKELYKKAFDVAKENNIKCQTKTAVAGGNDAGAIHLSRSGVKTIGISLPCRYIHTPSCVIKESDLNDTFLLLSKLIVQLYD